MNNEMQRKYLTSIKRLMRFAQVCMHPCMYALAWWHVVDCICGGEGVRCGSIEIGGVQFDRHTNQATFARTVPPSSHPPASTHPPHQQDKRPDVLPSKKFF